MYSIRQFVYSFLTTGSLSKFLFAQPMQSQRGPILPFHAGNSKFYFVRIFFVIYARPNICIEQYGDPLSSQQNKQLRVECTKCIHISGSNLSFEYYFRGLFAFWRCEDLSNPFERVSCLPSQVQMLRIQ